MTSSRVGPALLLSLAVGCAGAGKARDPGGSTASTSGPTGEPRAGDGTSSSLPSGSASASGRAAPGASASAASADPPPLTGKPPTRTLRELFQELSEPERADRAAVHVSSETSLLQVAPLLLARDRPGGAYVGVGAEQNFTYIALVRPQIAFIVTPRRSSALVHLLYKAMFDEARTRSEFLSFLNGRPYHEADNPKADASATDVIAHAEELGRFSELHSTTLERLMDRISTKYGIRLSAADRAALKKIHKAFYDHGLDIRREPEGKAGDEYPKLRQQLALRAPNGLELGFLSHERWFRYVQRMHREDRIIPVVGDLTGPGALRGIAAYLGAEKIPLRTFYVSDEEARVFDRKAWPKWADNVAAFPVDEHSLFVRTWVDQAERHPHQLSGERTTTLIQRVADFRSGPGSGSGSGWSSYRALAFDASNRTDSAPR